MQTDDTLTDWLSENVDIQFIKYQYTDMQGNTREVTLTRESINGDGRTSVDGSSVFGKMILPTESDMLLIPDPSTVSKIPWMDKTARVVCNMFHPPEHEGEQPIHFRGCPRTVLMKVEEEMHEILDPIVLKASETSDGSTKARYHAHFAPELEFLLLDSDYKRDMIHIDQSLANNHYFVPPQRKVDAALKQMIDFLGEMGLKKEKYHTEVTTYQYEIGIGHGNVVKIADAAVTIKDIIEKVAEMNGLYASFIPKFRKGVNGSGMHVHQNLAVTMDGKEKNLFYDESKEDCLSDIGRSYIAGLLKYASEITAFTNAVPVSYKRLVPGCEAPTYICWDWQNRTALCRGHSQNSTKIRVEYRSPDPKCNPYLAFAAMLSAGLSGINEGLKLSPPDKRDFYHDNRGIKELPENLGVALEKMSKSKMLRSMMGDYIIDNVHMIGAAMWKDYCQEVSDIDIRRYF